MKGQRTIQLDPSWLKHLEAEFHKTYMAELRTFLVEEKRKYLVFPPGKDIFNALAYTPFDAVRVVILGQDPYHGQGQAHGLCFSVKQGTKTPPSLQNIFKELQQDVGIRPPTHGELTHWAHQGVLLLNTVLTVRAHEANSHRNKGWEQFTDQVISLLNEKREGLVFVLWGSAAGRKSSMIDTSKHCILRSPHPSPLSAHRGFFGSRHFSQINAHLSDRGEPPIDWQIPCD